MMKVHLIVVNENSIKLDFFHHCFPRSQMLILIGSSRCINGMSERTKMSLSKIIKTDKFSLEEILRIIDTLQLNIDYSSDLNIVTNDECVEILCAQIREKLGLQGPIVNEVRQLFLKNEAKSRLIKAGIKCPNFIVFSPSLFLKKREDYVASIINKLSLPLVAKPIDSTSSCGVSIIKSSSNLLTWCDNHKEALNYEIEEFIDGTTHNCDCIVKSGKVIHAQVAEGINPCFYITQGKTIAYRVLPNNSPTYNEMLSFNIKTLNALSVPDGATHTEIFRKSDGELVFLEMSARPSGGDLRWVYQQYDGVDIEKAHFLIRMDLPYMHQTKPTGIYAAHVEFPTRKGTVTRINAPNFKSKNEVIWNIKVGEQLTNAADLAASKAGTVRLYGDQHTVREDLEYLREFIPYDVI